MPERAVIDRTAKAHGGECLSAASRLTAATALTFVCAVGHRWDALAGAIVAGSWCPECARPRRRYSIVDMQRLASERGGECLSKRRSGTVSPLRWRCARGHRWQMNPHNLLYSGTWCRACEQADQLAGLADIVSARGGALLSRRYTGARSKLRVRCGGGHTWSMDAGAIRRGSWCVLCAGRAPITVERLRRAARAHGGESLEPDDAKLHINRHARWRCAKGHEWNASPGNVMNGTWCPRCNRRVKMTLADVDAHAASRGERCLTRSYEGSHQMLEWECAEGHRWCSTRHRIMNSGRWCPTCAGVIPVTIEQMQQLAIDRGGMCLSPSYANSRTSLRWRCAEGHAFTLAPKLVKVGRWCARCARAEHNARSVSAE